METVRQKTTRSVGTSMSNRGMYKSVNKGVPALVCIPTGETIIIDGKSYRMLKLMYDLKGEYMPFAPPLI